MTTLIVTIHIFVCLALIMIVLLQTGKGASIGASLGGGGSQALLGGSGASTFLSKATTIIAVIFMLTSLSLAYISSHKSQGSIVSEITAPSEQTIPVDSALPVEQAEPSETSAAAATENVEKAAPEEGTPQNN